MLELDTTKFAEATSPVVPVTVTMYVPGVSGGVEVDRANVAVTVPDALTVLAPPMKA